MSSDSTLSLSRRQVLGASAGLAALSLMPISAVATPNPAPAESGLQSWVKLMSPEAEPVASGDSQRWLFRHLGGELALSLGLVYRACPAQPFELFRGRAQAAQGGVSVEAVAGAIQGLAIQRLDRTGASCETCPFDNWLQPGLQPGQYAVLINSGQRRWRPDWSLAAWDPARGIEPASGMSDPVWNKLTLLSLDVRPA